MRIGADQAERGGRQGAEPQRAFEPRPFRRTQAPPGAHPQDAKTEASAKQVADLIRSAEGRDGQGPSVEQAQLELGEKYYQGEGVPRDMAKAAEWWQEAWEGWNSPVQLPSHFRLAKECTDTNCLARNKEHWLYSTGHGFG